MLYSKLCHAKYFNASSRKRIPCTTDHFSNYETFIKTNRYTLQKYGICPFNQLHKFFRTIITIIMKATNRHISPYYSFPYYSKKLRFEIQDILLSFAFDDENLYHNDFPVYGLVLLVRLVEIGPLSKCR